jgi:predicted SnoaL-like aldol condensation-catalyzing enzyme
MDPGEALIYRFYALLGAGDVEGVAALYGDDAAIVRYDGVAATRAAIITYFEGFLRRHGACSLRSIDQFRESDDVVMWDAMLDTDDGVLQSAHVVVLDTRRAIRRHVPDIRGYWGK